ncbi:MAG: Gx transporter family protein [Lachnospiraceae bacterium]
MKKNKTARVAYTGMMVALAFVLSYVEALIPISLGIPGAKIGLANLVIMVALYTIGTGQAFVLSMVRILLVGFTFGSMASMMYSLAGGLLSFAVMAAAKKWDCFTMTGVSILGGVFHNIGQILMAVAVVENGKLLYYLPVLLVFGVLAGVAIGMAASMVTKRIQKAWKE